jgi:hypothetical protein
MTLPFTVCASVTAISAIIQSWIFYIGGAGYDGHCSYHGTLCLCEKHGLNDRKRGPNLNGVQWMAPCHGTEHDHRSGL